MVVVALITQCGWECPDDDGILVVQDFCSETCILDTDVIARHKVPFVGPIILSDISLSRTNGGTVDAIANAVVSCVAIAALGAVGVFVVCPTPFHQHLAEAFPSSRFLLLVIFQVVELALNDKGIGVQCVLLLLIGDSPCQHRGSLLAPIGFETEFFGVMDSLEGDSLGWQVIIDILVIGHLGLHLHLTTVVGGRNIKGITVF